MVTRIHDRAGRRTRRRQSKSAAQGTSGSFYCDNIENLEPEKEGGLVKFCTSCCCKFVRTELSEPKSRQPSLCSA